VHSQDHDLLCLDIKRIPLAGFLRIHNTVSLCVWLLLGAVFDSIIFNCTLFVFFSSLMFLTGLTAIIFSINYDCETLNHVAGTCTPPEAAQVMEPVVARGEIH